MGIRSAPARSASATWSPRRAKSAARIDGAIFPPSLCVSRPPPFSSSATYRFKRTLEGKITSRGTGRLLENFHKLAVAAGNVVYRLFPRDFLRSPVYERIPKTRAPHREADEPRNSRCRRQPLVYFL